MKKTHSTYTQLVAYNVFQLFILIDADGQMMDLKKVPKKDQAKVRNNSGNRTGFCTLQ